MFRWREAAGRFYPIAVWLLLLVIVFVEESAVMLVLPSLLRADTPKLLEAAVDSLLLTLIVAPVLWWMIVRPLQETMQMRTKFLADLFEQIERDRRQTAYELHDGIGQSLTLLVSGLRSAKSGGSVEEWRGRAADFQRLAENALAEVRRVSLGLRPSMLDDLGLGPALERLVEDVRGHEPLTVSLDASGLGVGRIPDALATAIFRVVQEALTNVVKHAKAKEATVSVRKDGEAIVVEVRDDGLGMQVPRLTAIPHGHLGLRGISERAALLGGEFSLDSAPGRGTRITVRIPIGGATHG